MQAPDVLAGPTRVVQSPPGEFVPIGRLPRDRFWPSGDGSPPYSLRRGDGANTLPVEPAMNQLEGFLAGKSLIEQLNHLDQAVTNPDNANKYELYFVRAKVKLELIRETLHDDDLGDFDAVRDRLNTIRVPISDDNRTTATAQDLYDGFTNDMNNALRVALLPAPEAVPPADFSLRVYIICSKKMELLHELRQNDEAEAVFTAAIANPALNEDSDHRQLYHERIYFSSRYRSYADVLRHVNSAIARFPGDIGFLEFKLNFLASGEAREVSDAGVQAETHARDNHLDDETIRRVGATAARDRYAELLLANLAERVAIYKTLHRLTHSNYDLDGITIAYDEIERVISDYKGAGRVNDANYALAFLRHVQNEDIAALEVLKTLLPSPDLTPEFREKRLKLRAEIYIKIMRYDWALLDLYEIRNESTRPDPGISALIIQTESARDRQLREQGLRFHAENYIRTLQYDRALLNLYAIRRESTRPNPDPEISTLITQTEEARDRQRYAGVCGTVRACLEALGCMAPPTRDEGPHHD